MPKGGIRGEMPTKIRKRGCSSSSSSSSRIHHYRLNKRPIVVGRSRAGGGGSRSGTPAPTWRTAPLRSAVESPKCSSRPAQPVSARRLAATLWEVNEIPSPRVSESDLEAVKQRLRKSGTKAVFKREKMQSGWALRSSSGSGSLPPQSLTISEVNRSGIGSERRTASASISRRLSSAEQNAAVFGSVCNATSFMETESRSRPPTSTGSVSNARIRLKDVSNSLTTSKELVKIINRIWIQADQSSSSMAVISALHSEIERGRRQVNRLIQEEKANKDDGIHHLLKHFAEEKTSWKNKENRAVESAVASFAGELEVERKLRRHLESLNKKLGIELTEIKASLMKAVKELESEKRARELTEQLCDELARNVDEDRAREEKLKSESVKIHREAAKEREMLELADKLREGRVHMKLSEAKHHFEEKSSAINKLRKQLEVFLGAKREKDEERETRLSKSNIISLQHDEREAEDTTESKADSQENDHSIELISSNMKNSSKIHKWASCSSAVSHDSKKLQSLDEIKARNSISGHLQRAISEGVEWGIRRGKGDASERQRFPELEKEASRRSYFDETQRHRSVKGLIDRVLSSPRSSITRDCYSPSPSRKPKW